MKNVFKFKKFYSKVDDLGIAYDSIILFDKRPMLYKTVEQRLDDDVLANIKSGGVYCYKQNTFVSQYQYRLQIDLWFMFIRLKWNGRIRKEKEKYFFDIFKSQREHLINQLSDKIKKERKAIYFNEKI